MRVHTRRSRSRIGGIRVVGETPKAFNEVDADFIFESCGPIVEQGTHFCDLSRYFGGEVDISSVTAHSLEWDEKAGKLSKVPIDEEKIAPENRIPRVTAATW